MSAFVPQYSIIQSISQGVTTTVTFTEDCDFIPGEVVSFRVSRQSGMSELNNQQTVVLSSNNNSITVPINTTNYTPYIEIEENLLVFPAMVVPVGSGIVPGSIPVATNLEDAFDNIPIN